MCDVAVFVITARSTACCFSCCSGSWSFGRRRMYHWFGYFCIWEMSSLCICVLVYWRRSDVTTLLL